MTPWRTGSHSQYVRVTMGKPRRGLPRRIAAGSLQSRPARPCRWRDRVWQRPIASQPRTVETSAPTLGSLAVNLGGSGDAGA